jgi:hypothetical protein
MRYENHLLPRTLRCSHYINQRMADRSRVLLGTYVF